MQLLAAGSNAWHQLQFGDRQTEDEEPDDITTFTIVLEGQTISNLRPSFTCTAVRVAGNLLVAGAPITKTTGGYPDHDCAEALNGHVADFDGCDTIYEYVSAEDLYSKKAHCAAFPGIPAVVQVVAYDTGFAALTLNGQVFTWGDGRFPMSLGRDVSDDSPADKPGLVTCLEGLPTGPIVKIAAGGYVLAALTRGSDLYCWGSYPGRSPLLRDLDRDPTPIAVIPNGASDGTNGDNEGIDIADVGLGEAHMIVLSTDGRVCVMGSNANGQLGLGYDHPAAASWNIVDLQLQEGQTVVGIAAGPRSSFIMVDSR